jgi:citrate lyase beta subunit
MFRSLLFVPAHRPERFDKAIAAKADSVCIDMEDAVPLPDRPVGRENLRSFFKTPRAGGPAVGVRMNCVRSIDGARDLDALSQMSGIDFIMVPKVDHSHELAIVEEVFAGKVPLWPIMESAKGFRNVWAIAAAPNVHGIVFGAADFSSDVRCEMEWEPLLVARGTLASACAAAEIELLDVPHIDVHDTEGLIASTKRVRAMGFTGRACIHPGQVAEVNRIFSPSDTELTQARRVMEAFEKAHGAATLLDGRLVERPQIRAAQRILSLAS